MEIKMQITLNIETENFTKGDFDNWVGNQFGFNSLNKDNPIWTPHSGHVDLRDAVVSYMDLPDLTIDQINTPPT